MGVLQETKLTDGIHAHQGEGYSVWVTEAESRHRGVIVVFWREDVGWQVEGIVNFGPNMVRLFLTSWSGRWYVVGAYVPPNYAPAVHHIKQALEVAPKGMEVIMLGDTNIRMRELWEDREDKITSEMAGSGLGNMKDHFMPRWRYRGTGSWMY